MLQVSVPIAHELLGQCIKQGEALVQRASLVGDFSDYESWKSARKQWIDPTVQALEHMYGGSKEGREFADVVTCPESVKRWQEQYSADLRCVEEAIDLLKVLQGELAFTGGTAQPGHAGGPAGELGQGSDGESNRPGDTNGLATTEQLRKMPAIDVDAPSIEAPDPSPHPDEHAAADTAPGEPAREAQAPDPSAEARVSAQDPSPQAPHTPLERPFAEPPAERRDFQQAAVGAELTPAQSVGVELAPQETPGTPAERDEGGAAAAPARTRQVLLAHGRDEGWKQAVEHLLEQAGEHEIRIVNRRAERGRLTEVLGEETPARYAVVLLTADDVGGPRLESNAEPYFSTRAHQEVVFEMGFLIAALSPGRVCVLYEDGVELPYDLEGVSHVRLDLAGTWQPKLLLHLRRAGFDYDMNKLAA
ncbi:MAG TPA: TIR domain-containing protein [Solirubrobacteraceae bacterium]|nr:TIR domain-containing protein [Solirubrobacteraceae bacterium]